MTTVLVTGANRGIGLEFVRQYAADGYKVIATCRDPKDSKDLERVNGDVTVLPLDVVEDDWSDSLGACLKRSVGVTRAAARRAVEDGTPLRVVTFSSSSTFHSEGALQSSLNAAMLSLAGAAATTLAPHGIPVNCLVLGGADQQGEPMAS